MFHVSSKFGNDIQRNKATVLILVKVKEAKAVINVRPLTPFKQLANQVISRK